MRGVKMIDVEDQEKPTDHEGDSSRADHTESTESARFLAPLIRTVRLGMNPSTLFAARHSVYEFPAA
jgi:hypothetical protein